MNDEQTAPDQPSVTQDVNPALQMESTPVVLKRRVRRLNNMPLVIVIGAATLFIAVMTYTVLSRSPRSSQAEEKITGDSAASIAAKIIGTKSAPESPAFAKKDSGSATPPSALKADRPNVSSTPPTPAVVRNPDFDWIRQKKLHLLEQAILGDARVNSFASQPAAPAPNTALATEIERVQRELRNSQNSGDKTTANLYRLQLAALQERAVAAGIDLNSSTQDSNDLSKLDRGATGSVTSLQSPRTKYILRTGSIIPATLISGINSDLPGQILGQVSQNVYDSPTGNYLLIPQGTRLVGEYSSKVKYGQSRVFAVWQRIVFPDGKAMDLGAFPAATGAGYAGMKDKVDNHYIRIFGSAIMLSGIIAGVEYSQNQETANSSENTQRMSDTMSSSLGQTLGQTMAEMIRKNMSIAPTLEIRPGFRLNVMLVKDLEFTTPYRAFDWRR